MNGGAYVAIAASARARRMQKVVDAFRIADATSPERARGFDEVGVDRGQSVVDDLLHRAVLAPGRREGTFYVDERGYIAHRDERRRRARLAMLLMVVIALGVMGAGLLAALGAR
jgi:hypothetical protein